MARKINDRSLNLDPTQENALQSDDIAYTESESLKTKIDNSTLPDVAVDDDSKLLESYYITPPAYGNESDGSVSTSGQINDYTHLISDVLAGSMSVTVAVADPAAAGFVVGKECMLHQTQAYRDVSNKFKYEFVRIASIDGQSVTFETSLVNNYLSDPTGNKLNNTMTQLISIPNYIGLTMTGALVAKSWDGESGGIVSFKAKTLTGTDAISAEGRGFRNVGGGSGYIIGESFQGAGATGQALPDAEVFKGAYALYSSPSYYAGGGCNGAGGADRDDNPPPNDITIAKGGDDYGYTNTDLDTVLPIGGGGVSRYSAGGHAGGAVLVFVENPSAYTGTYDADGGAPGTVHVTTGGCAVVRTEIAYVAGQSSLLSATRKLGSYADGHYGANGYTYASEPSVSATKGFKKGRKISPTYEPAEDSNILEQGAVKELVQTTAPPAVKLGEWNSLKGDYIVDDFVSYQGDIWKCLIANDFNDPKEPGVDIGHWKNVTEELNLDVVRSSIVLNNQIGYGSDTGNKILRFGVITEQVGSDVSYTDDSVYGAYFTINKSGLYTISHASTYNSIGYSGISKNSDQLTSSIDDIVNNSYRLCAVTSNGTDEVAQSSATVYLNAGDIIRPHGDGTPVGSSPQLSKFSIVRIGDLESQGSFTKDTALLSVWRSTDFGVTGTASNILFDQILWDNNNAYTPATGEWVSPRDMRVRVNGQVRNNGTPDNIFVEVYVNGVVVATKYGYSTPGWSSVDINKVVDVSIGDTVSLRASCSTVKDLHAASQDMCFFQISEEKAGDAAPTDKGQQIEFTSADISAGILTVNHQLGQKHVLQAVMDNEGDQVPVWPTFIDNQTIEYDFTGVTVTGTWSIVLGIGGRSLAEINTVVNKEIVDSDYSILNSDGGKTIDMDSATDHTVNILSYATEPVEPGYQFTISREGTGQVFIDAAAGVLLNDVDGGVASITNQYDQVTLRAKDPANNIWRIFGSHGGVA